VGDIEKRSGRAPKGALRLPNYDYSWPGAYFLTMVTENREGLFGQVLEDIVHLNHVGQIAVKCWEEAVASYLTTFLDAYIVMPNHVHAIVVISDKSLDQSVGAIHESPLHAFSKRRGFPRSLADSKLLLLSLSTKPAAHLVLRCGSVIITSM